MAPICELEEKHGVILGSGYKNDQACATFVGYIAQIQRELLASVLVKAKYFAIQGDGSTDSEDMKEELFYTYTLTSYLHAVSRGLGITCIYMWVQTCQDLHSKMWVTPYSGDPHDIMG